MQKLAGLGTVNPPPGVNQFKGGKVAGIPVLLSIIFRTLIVLAAIFTVFNLIFAGYDFISAGSDPKKIQDAWSRIWQSLLGLTIAAGAFVLAAVVGRLIFGDANAILQVRIFTP